MKSSRILSAEELEYLLKISNSLYTKILLLFVKTRPLLSSNQKGSLHEKSG
jgi:hypothetical protein